MENNITDNGHPASNTDGGNPQKPESIKPTAGKSTQAVPTIFDDVFHTIVVKMPYLLIALINEVFDTDYSSDEKITHLRNEQYTENRKIITDSAVQIKNHVYHIECQSCLDKTMVLRMIEYDMAIAVENAGTGDDGIYEISLPHSCVMYIRNHRSLGSFHTAVVSFPDGQKASYRIPVIRVQDYSLDEIFSRKLLIMLPFYILRYESFLKSGSSDGKKLSALLSEMKKISDRLAECNRENIHEMYTDISNLILRIANYIIPDKNPAKERIGDIMGGTVLELPSDIIRNEGREEGWNEGIEQGIEQGREEGIEYGIENMILDNLEDGKPSFPSLSGALSLPPTRRRNISGNTEHYDNIV